MTGARVLMFAVVLLTALLLQTVVFAGLSVAGWRPDLVLVTVVAFGLAEGPDTGLRYGFAAGLVSDLLSGGGLVGVGALVLCLVGYTTGSIRPYLSTHLLAGQIAVAAIAGAGAVLAHGVLSRSLGLPQYRVDAVLAGALAIGLYDALVAPLVCRPIALLTERYAPAVPPGSSFG